MNQNRYSPAHHLSSHLIFTNPISIQFCKHNHSLSEDYSRYFHLKKIKTFPFTLIEVSIALFLCSILLTTLFFYFAQIRKVEEKIGAAQEAIFSRASLQMRLDQIFSSITPLEAPDFLFTENEPIEIHCVFDNGIDPDPDFSGPVQARLYIDKEKNYCLTIIPLEKESEKMRTEILKKGVHFITYEFLPPQWTVGKTKLEKKWPREKKKLPSLIRMELDGMKFAFFLPTIDPVITFFDSEKQ